MLKQSQGAQHEVDERHSPQRLLACINSVALVLGCVFYQLHAKLAGF